MLTTRPMMTPTKRSVNTIAATVMTYGINRFQPSSHMARTIFGLASLKPVTIRMAARHDSGMRLSVVGRKTVQSSSNTP